MKSGARTGLVGSVLRIATLTAAVIIAVFVCSTIFRWARSAIRVADDAKIETDLAALSQSLEAYRSFNGTLPTTAQGLDALVNSPMTEPKPGHWYQMLIQLPKDPYHREYVYACPGTHHPDGYDLYTKGYDGIAGTADDVGNWAPGWINRLLRR